MKQPDVVSLKKKARSEHAMPVANLGLGLIIFIVFVLSVVYGESIF